MNDMMKRDGVLRGCASPSLIGCSIMMHAQFQVDEVSESLELGHTLPHWPDGSQGAARGTLTSQGRNQELADIQNLLQMLSTSRGRASTTKCKDWLVWTQGHYHSESSNTTGKTTAEEACKVLQPGQAKDPVERVRRSRIKDEGSDPPEFCSAEPHLNK